MGSSSQVVDRMDQRVTDLCADFLKHLTAFNSSDLFGGPSLYFHRKAIGLRRQHASVRTLLNDDAFFDALYATLTAWGMHRMGPGNTKLRDLTDIRKSVERNAESLEGLSRLAIGSVSADETKRIVAAVWNLIANLEVSKAKARIVANSKLLHHILPDLVPPMDREYTFQFFYGRGMLSIGEDRAFSEMFSRLLQIGELNRATIDATPTNGWNSGPAKMVDNAIVGYMRSHQKSSAGQHLRGVNYYCRSTTTISAGEGLAKGAPLATTAELGNCR